MEICFNVTGTERKSLVNAISQELNTPIKYLGAPTFAYEVSGYRIDKNGTVTGADNNNLVADLQGLHDFKAISAEYDKPLPTVPSVRDLPNNLIIEVLLQDFTDMALENLNRLISSKAALIKKAIGADALPVEQTETTLKFPWFRFCTEPETVSAYAHFIGALCTTAKQQKRVTAKEKDVDNEKYAFRCFLLRLGLIGDEYKTARKVLLKNLTGNAAYKQNSEKVVEDDE